METPNLLLLLFGLGLFLFVFYRPRAGLRRGPATGAEPDPREVHQELDSVVVRLQEVSREQLARLDTKIQILNQLVGEADRKIGELKALAGSRGAAPAPEAQPPEPPPRPVNPLHERVFGLADGGAPFSQIAAETGLSAGEVDLILGLRGGRRREAKEFNDSTIQ